MDGPASLPTGETEQTRLISQGSETTSQFAVSGRRLGSPAVGAESAIP